MNGFSNGQAKYFLFELTSLVRPLLCPKHTLQLNLYILAILFQRKFRNGQKLVDFVERDVPDW